MNASELASALPPLIILAAVAVGAIVNGRSRPSGRDVLALAQRPGTEREDRA